MMIVIRIVVVNNKILSNKKNMFSVCVAIVKRTFVLFVQNNKVLLSVANKNVFKGTMYTLRVFYGEKIKTQNVSIFSRQLVIKF